MKRRTVKKRAARAQREERRLDRWLAGLHNGDQISRQADAASVRILDFFDRFRAAGAANPFACAVAFHLATRRPTRAD